MTSEEIRNQIKRQGELLKAQLAVLKQSLKVSDDLDVDISSMEAMKTTMDKIPMLTQLHKEQLEKEGQKT